MLKLVLMDSATGKALKTMDYGPEVGTFLSTISPPQMYGTFKCTKIASGDGTGSYTVVTPIGNGSITLTDLIVSFEKKTSAEVTLQFNDGTYTEIVWFGDMQDAPLNLAIGFVGKWQGWQSAYLEIVVAGAGLDGSIAVGYTKISHKQSLPYTEWNSLR